jgi:hypothetical protein
VTGASRAYRTISQEFLFDLHEHWKVHCKQILDEVAKSWPQLYFHGMVKLAQIHRLEIGGPGDFQAAQSRAELLGLESASASRPG